MTIVALDLGERKIGVAIADGLGLGAQPLTTVRRRKLEADVASLGRIFADYAVARVVIGLPLNMDGSEGPAARKARRFGAILADRLGISVEFHDERLSTREAEQRLAILGVGRKARADAVDRMAAAVILEDWMATIGPGGSGEGGRGL